MSVIPEVTLPILLLFILFLVIILTYLKSNQSSPKAIIIFSEERQTAV